MEDCYSARGDRSHVCHGEQLFELARWLIQGGEPWLGVMPLDHFDGARYLTDHMRLMFNYSYAVPQEPNLGTSVANIFAMRLGVFW